MTTTTTSAPMLQRLLTPEPTAVPPEVLREMVQPIIHHRIAGVWRAVQIGLRLDPDAWRDGFPYRCRVEPIVPELSGFA